MVLVSALGLPDAGAQQPKLKVGILHIGSIADAGYNQAHAEGVAVMKKNLPEVEVIEVENVPEGADAERVMENMIKQGAKLIIAASFGYLDPALRVAKKYPEVKFVHPGGYKLAPNLSTYWASTPEAFYLMGIAAGKTTKTNKMGFVGALPISFFLANVNAFHLGARSVNPKVETRVVFTGTFLDPGKEATAANALLDQGVDVIGVIVDSPITVVQTAEKRGAYSVGYHYLGVQKFAPKGWISGVAFTWGAALHPVRQAGDGRHLEEREYPWEPGQRHDCHRALRPRSSPGCGEDGRRHEAGIHLRQEERLCRPDQGQQGSRTGKSRRALVDGQPGKDGLAGGRDRGADKIKEVFSVSVSVSKKF